MTFHLTSFRDVAISYGLVFATLYQFYRQIPATYKFRVLGITLSDKAYVYFLALQLAVLQYPLSLVPATCGLLAGVLYASDLGGIKKWRFPKILQSFAQRTLLPLLATAPSRGTAATMEQVYGPSIHNQNLSLSSILNEPGQATTMGRTYMETMAEGIPQTLREEEIVALMTMFPDVDRQMVVTALQSANNDVNAAAAALLER
ncbi:hypothetical protein IWQ60_009266 [Tieghemiomyces parasiticus]|uniref:CUE domain-containing protein n=1 Tax=Tieghemiomyces parasiticus TaxID=78921 RepID=A0A9W8DQF3_9FUNG|nr:hypothetical protein IWQ60_009266 [Tieghemiomyces parasiticus]